MKMKKAYLINAEARRIDEVKFSDYKDIQNLIGCERFDIAAYLNDNDALYVDDEGYLNPHVKKGFYYCQHPFFGVTGDSSPQNGVTTLVEPVSYEG